jgi:putative spermidine/putrescine transport system ATP-binding protein
VGAGEVNVVESRRAVTDAAGAAAVTSPGRRPGDAGEPKHSVQLEALCKQYGAVGAVRNVSLDVRQGEFLTLLGPSGSGKTTTLMMIAGFIDPSSGRIRVDGRDVTDEPPHRRNIGMVFQNYALFPHLTVFKNVAFPLDVRKFPAGEIRERTRDALEIVKLADFGDRYPSQLSGGQQQRVALARAIVFRPPLLLMDEPLGALDKKLREHMQIELMKIQDRLGVTVIYVTHDQEEALVMSDRVVVMADGEIQQVGRPEELYQRPANRFVADFIGETNILPGEVTMGGSAASVAIAPDVEVRAPSSRVWSKGDRAFLILRPECVRIGAAAQACGNRMQGKVERVIYVGDASRIHVMLANGQALIAKMQNSGPTRGIDSGDDIAIGWDSDSTWLVGEAGAQLASDDGNMETSV